jgi:RsiW-degrading membrane proteinase PrsW (M82 family)
MPAPAAMPPPSGPPLVAAYAPPRIQQKPVRKWLGRRGGLLIVGVMAALWLFTMFVTDLALQNSAVFPVALILGSFAATAGFVYTMAYRLRPDAGIRPAFLVFATVVGGGVASLLAAPLDRLLDLLAGAHGSQTSVYVPLIAGGAEEFVKIAVVVAISWRVAKKSALNGLFIGGAVGFGFSGFENLAYEWRGFDLPIYSLGHYGSLTAVTLLRELSGPLGHPIFTAIIAAAVFRASRNGRFRLTLGVVGAFLLGAGLHASRDGLLSLPQLVPNDPVIAGLLGLALVVTSLLAPPLIWRRIVKREHLRALPPPASPPMMLSVQYVDSPRYH